MQANLYDLPEYYDVAFSWDISPEIELLGKLFARHVPFPVERVLEPACGSGRFLVGLPRFGYRVTGYDSNPKMLAYARRRIAAAGLAGRATAQPGDMRTARFEESFDAAINSINSLGYLLADEDVVAHFRNTGDALRPGGVYVVQIACAWDRLHAEDTSDWTMQRQGIQIRTRWRIEAEDRAAKLSHQLCRMEIDDHGRRSVLEERHTLRLWLAEDLRRLAGESGALELAAIHDAKGEPISPDGHISGELGNLYWVLKA